MKEAFYNKIHWDVEVYTESLSVIKRWEAFTIELIKTLAPSECKRGKT